MGRGGLCGADIPVRPGLLLWGLFAANKRRGDGCLEVRRFGCRWSLVGSFAESVEKISAHAFESLGL